MEEQIVQVSTTVGGREEAVALARLLVERRLAACVQVSGPVESCYRWQGAVDRAEEWLCVAKTTPAAAEALVEAVQEAHPYEVPEILAATVSASAGYARWVAEELRARAGG